MFNKPAQMAQNRIAIYMDIQRRKNDLLMEEFSVCRTTVYNWMKNKYQPDIFKLKKIAELLGTTMEDLIEE